MTFQENKKHNVLITRKYGSIGDMLMMTPALKEFGKKFKIDILVPKDYKDVFSNLPYINKILCVEENIDYLSYSKIIDLTDFEFNYEQVYQPYIQKTKVELFGDALNLSIKSNKLDIILSKEEKNWIEAYLEENNLKNKKIILVGVKSANPTRDWPIDKWKIFINKIKNLNYNIIVVDKDLYWEDKNLIFFNNHSMRELFALVSRADFIICNDSGLLHIGGAFEKFLIGIFGPTDPKMRSIYKNSFFINNNIGIEHSWYNRSKEEEYFKAISPTDVERKFLEILQNEYKFN